MDNQDEDVQVEQETVEQEETTEDETESQPEDTVVITKEKFKAMQEKAIKFDESLKKPKPKANPSHVTPELDNATIARIYDIHEDDIEEVLDLAKFKKLSLAETLKLGATKAILAEKAEFRKTAETSNTGNARRGVGKVSDDVLLKNLSDGKIPAPGSEDAERLFWAKRGGKR
jgi:hypothetical protein